METEFKSFFERTLLCHHYHIIEIKTLSPKTEHYFLFKGAAGAEGPKGPTGDPGQAVSNILDVGKTIISNIPVVQSESGFSIICVT